MGDPGPFVRAALRRCKAQTQHARLSALAADRCDPPVTHDAFAGHSSPVTRRDSAVVVGKQPELPKEALGHPWPPTTGLLLDEQLDARPTAAAAAARIAGLTDRVDRLGPGPNGRYDRALFDEQALA